MAGDWLKITHELPSKPEVLALSGQLGITRWEVVGRLHALWTWLDQHTEKGHAPNVTATTLCDSLFGDELGRQFADALQEVGWLAEDDSGVWAPNFDRHISKTAKNRALASQRKQRSRTSHGEGHDTGQQLSREERDKGVTREEVEEEKKGEVHEQSSSANRQPEYPSDFEQLWAEKPERAGGNPKREAYQAYSARLKAGYTYEQMLEGLRRYAAYLEATGKLGTEFVQTVATFLGPKKLSFLEDWTPPKAEEGPESDGPRRQKLG